MESGTAIRVTRSSPVPTRFASHSGLPSGIMSGGGGSGDGSGIGLGLGGPGPSPMSMSMTMGSINGTGSPSPGRRGRRTSVIDINSGRIEGGHGSLEDVGIAPGSAGSGSGSHGRYLSSSHSGEGSISLSGVSGGPGLGAGSGTGLVARAVSPSPVGNMIRSASGDRDKKRPNSVAGGRPRRSSMYVSMPSTPSQSRSAGGVAVSHEGDEAGSGAGGASAGVSGKPSPLSRLRGATSVGAGGRSGSPGTPTGKRRSSIAQAALKVMAAKRLTPTGSRGRSSSISVEGVSDHGRHTRDAQALAEALQTIAQRDTEIEAMKQSYSLLEEEKEDLVLMVNKINRDNRDAILRLKARLEEEERKRLTMLDKVHRADRIERSIIDLYMEFRDRSLDDPTDPKEAADHLTESEAETEAETEADENASEDGSESETEATHTHSLGEKIRSMADDDDGDADANQSQSQTPERENGVKAKTSSKPSSRVHKDKGKGTGTSSHRNSHSDSQSIADDDDDHSPDELMRKKLSTLHPLVVLDYIRISVKDQLFFKDEYEAEFKGYGGGADRQLPQDDWEHMLELESENRSLRREVESKHAQRAGSRASLGLDNGDSDENIDDHSTDGSGGSSTIVVSRALLEDLKSSISDLHSHNQQLLRAVKGSETEVDRLSEQLAVVQVAREKNDSAWQARINAVTEDSRRIKQEQKQAEFEARAMRSRSDKAEKELEMLKQKLASLNRDLAFQKHQVAQLKSDDQARQLRRLQTLTERQTVENRTQSEALRQMKNSMEKMQKENVTLQHEYDRLFKAMRQAQFDASTRMVSNSVAAAAAEGVTGAAAAVSGTEADKLQGTLGTAFSHARGGESLIAAYRQELRNKDRKIQELNRKIRQLSAGHHRAKAQERALERERWQMGAEIGTLRSQVSVLANQSQAAGHGQGHGHGPGIGLDDGSASYDYELSEAGMTDRGFGVDYVAMDMDSLMVGGDYSSMATYSIGGAGQGQGQGQSLDLSQVQSHAQTQAQAQTRSLGSRLFAPAQSSTVGSSLSTPTIPGAGSGSGSGSGKKGGRTPIRTTAAMRSARKPGSLLG